MFGIVDVIAFCALTFFITSIMCFFVVGVSTSSREANAYQEGYYKGFNDGKKVGRENDI